MARAKLLNDAVLVGRPAIGGPRLAVIALDAGAQSFEELPHQIDQVGCLFLGNDRLDNRVALLFEAFEVDLGASLLCSLPVRSKRGILVDFLLLALVG
jgi:hypothetical protein